MKLRILYFFLVCIHLKLSAQFAPPAGEPGSTAIHQSDERFLNWASEGEFIPSWLNIADTSLGLVPATDINAVLGAPDGVILSMGDGGQITLSFDPPIRNGAGFDFAVFENGFSDTFLELAFVEVSSDGTHFVRFPATSNNATDEQIGPFGSVDARKLNNLAGKYRVEYGTPFDLEELKDSSGIDLDHISHVRLIDVVGSIEAPYAQFDAQGQIVNDPWPTPFETSGFDLEAVGVLNQVGTVSTQILNPSAIRLFPNPSFQGEQVQIEGYPFEQGQWQIINMQGQVQASGLIQTKDQLRIPVPLEAGYYFLQLINQEQIFTQKWMVR